MGLVPLVIPELRTDHPGSLGISVLSYLLLVALFALALRDVDRAPAAGATPRAGRTRRVDAIFGA